MKSYILIAALLPSLLPCLLKADGGAVILRQDTASYTVTVFAAPVPVQTGLSDISFLIQKRGSLEPVLDAEVEFVTSAGSVPATHGQAQNKLLYAAMVDMAQAGVLPWSARATRAGLTEEVSGTLNVGVARTSSADWLRFVIPAPLGILLFSIHQYLAGTRKKSAILIIP